MELSTYYICLLLKGPAWTAHESPELAQLQSRHVAHIGWTVSSGAAVAGGPVTDGGRIVGFSVYKTATLEEARAIAESDPAVRAGRFVVEMHPWMTPAGQLPAPAAKPQDAG